MKSFHCAVSNFSTFERVVRKDFSNVSFEKTSDISTSISNEANFLMKEDVSLLVFMLRGINVSYFSLEIDIVPLLLAGLLLFLNNSLTQKTLSFLLRSLKLSKKLSLPLS